MAKYSLDTDITEAAGGQTWTVEADSPKEAIKLIQEGKGDISYSEIEALSSNIMELTEKDIYLDETI